MRNNIYVLQHTAASSTPILIRKCNVARVLVVLFVRRSASSLASNLWVVITIFSTQNRFTCVRRQLDLCLLQWTAKRVDELRRSPPQRRSVIRTGYARLTGAVTSG